MMASRILSQANATDRTPTAALILKNHIIKTNQNKNEDYKVYTFMER
jgi:hypothetical protein